MRSFWFTIVGILACLQLVQGFGAGNIPDYAVIKGFCLIPQSPLIWDYLTPVPQKEFPSWRYREHPEASRQE
jgi:hypothetical protein